MNIQDDRHFQSAPVRMILASTLRLLRRGVHKRSWEMSNLSASIVGAIGSLAPARPRPRERLEDRYGKIGIAAVAAAFAATNASTQPPAIGAESTIPLNASAQNAMPRSF